MRRTRKGILGVTLAAALVPSCSPIAFAEPGPRTLVAQEVWGGPGHATEYPSGLELAPDGSFIVIADTGNNAVGKYTRSPNGTFALAWKTGRFGTGVPTPEAPAPQFNNPRDVGVDSAGNVYVADTVNSRIVKLAGSDGSWVTSYKGPPKDFIGSAMGVTVGTVGGVESVLVSDAGDKVLRVFNTALTSQVRRITQPPDIRCTFSAFRDATVDSAGNFYLANYTANNVLILGPDGSCLDKWGSKNTSTTGPTPGKFKNPYGVAVGRDPTIAGSPEVIYVASSNDNVIQEFLLDAAHSFVRFIGANDPAYMTPGHFNSLRRVTATSTTGYVCGADLWGWRVNCYDGGQFDRTVPESLEAPPGYANRPFEASAMFNEVRGLSFDNSGNVYATDTVNQRIVQLDSSGAPQRMCGGRGEEPTSFNWPRGAAFIRAAGQVVIADTKQSRLQMLRNMTTCEKKPYGGVGTGVGNFNWVAAVAVRESDQTAWFADWKNSRVTVWDVSSPDPVPLGAYGAVGSGTGQFNQPRGIAIGPDGKVWVADTNNNRVVQLTTERTTVSDFTPYTGNGALLRPEGVDVDDRAVYVADTNHDRVVVLDRGDPAAPPAQTIPGFLRPAVVAVNDTEQNGDPRQGWVYVADTYNDRIKLFRPE